MSQSLKSDRPPFHTVAMVCILFLKRCNNLTGEPLDYQLLDRIHYLRFCGLTDSVSIPDRAIV
ncbi:MAG: transposase [Candidatus Nitrotoga sp.]